MSIKTQVASVSNAIRIYKDAQGMFIGFGNKDTEWGTPSNPPLPLDTDTSLKELLGIARVSRVSLAKLADRNSTNTFLYDGVAYEKVNLGDAYSKKATFVLVEVDIKTDSFSSNVYRSVGLLESPTYSNSSIGDILQPSSIMSQGNLLTVKYVPKVDFTGYTVTEQILIEN